jgi:hypothetical protein
MMMIVLEIFILMHAPSHPFKGTTVHLTIITFKKCVMASPTKYIIYNVDNKSLNCLLGFVYDLKKNEFVYNLIKLSLIL